jgi:ArsR family transcriptional regulator
VELSEIYQGLSDSTRRRILLLLCDGPLCVCHFQKALLEPQVKISKHLSYLRERGLVEATREQNWMVYQLPVQRTRELEVHLECLKACAAEDPVLAEDRGRLRAVLDVSRGPSAVCRPDKRV